MKKILYVGLDVHKDTISAAVAAHGEEEVRFTGTISNNSVALESLLRKITSCGGIARFVYEAGPGGYTLYRQLREKGYECMVAAPSLIPRKSGDRIKTDKRDALMLARLYRAGELTGIYVPDKDDEAMRDLFRLRCVAKRAEKQARQNLLSFLLRNGVIYSVTRYWTKTHWRWLHELSLPHPIQQLTLQEHIDAILQCQNRITRIDGMLQQSVKNWRHEALVRRLHLLRGVSFLTAVGLVSELGDLRRFSSARQLMAYAGLVPSENSSGQKVRRAGITKTGNSNVRWLLVESAWSYRLKARKSAYLLKRQPEASEAAKELSWKAQVRLCGRYQRLYMKGKPKGKVITCVARELAGFIWALGRLVDE
jgi:transposase